MWESNSKDHEKQHQCYLFSSTKACIIYVTKTSSSDIRMKAKCLNAKAEFLNLPPLTLCVHNKYLNVTILK